MLHAADNFLIDVSNSQWNKCILWCWRTLYIPVQSQKEKRAECVHQFHCTISVSSR